MSIEKDPKLEFREDLLRQEIRGGRSLLVNLMQRGVAILAAVEVVLYIIRQDMTAHLRELGRLDPDGLLPFGRYMLGTLFLLLIAYIFARYAGRIADHYTHYRTQLVSMNPTFSGIAESIPVVWPTHHYVYYAFPAFDFLVWVLCFLGQLIGGPGGVPW